MRGAEGSGKSALLSVISHGYPMPAVCLALVTCFAKVMMEKSFKEVSVRGQHGIERCPLGRALVEDAGMPLLMPVLYSAS